MGAVVNWVKDLDRNDSVYCIVDLHALTIPKDPKELREKVRMLTASLVAIGVDPERCTLFAQSHVPQHAQLGWVMQCNTSYGELSRMTQFKDKRERASFVSSGLFSYPALQSADILLYDTEKVPVGADQRQHIELARDTAERFNSRYGETFVIPEHSIPEAGARIMDLQQPDNKMSKSLDSPQGTVLLADTPAAITKKFKRAVTDSDNEVYFDIENKPGVSNLLSILGAATGGDPKTLGENYEQYGPLKADTAEAVVSLIEPIQQRYNELISDQGELDNILATGASKAMEMAQPVLERAYRALGIGPV